MKNVRCLLSAAFCALNVAFPVAAQVTAANPVAQSEVDLMEQVWVFTAAPETKSVTIAGSFNGWNATSTPLTKQSDGTWRVALRLAPGKYAYKFVLDGTTWIVDSKARQNEDDGSGNLNSVLLLLPTDFDIAASTSDGIIARSALRHDTRFPALNWERGVLNLSMRSRTGDVSQVRLRVNNRITATFSEARNDLYQFHNARLNWDRKSDLSYFFEVRDGNTLRFFGANGLQDSAQQVRRFELKAREFQPFTVPDWVEQSVFYQIFPDRFANGDTRNDPPNVQKWSDAPTGFNRFGGDAIGVQQKLPYLKNLGINAVYFNPVFQSPSNHRYDAEDFLKIDPEIGTNQEFADLTRAMKAHNIRSVMDFVFNHTATTFAPFADVREKGAASKYKDWYFINSFPVLVQNKPNYQAWFGYPSMPKLNVMNPVTRDYLLDLVDFWHSKAGVSGLRLDVANEVEPAFWRLLRARAKKVDSQMWIVGEHWGDATPWLGGDQWDSVMNYQFRDACLKFFAEGSTRPSQLTSRLMQIHRNSGPQVSRNLMNLLSSHDTPRFLTLCKENAKLHQLAAAFQFTWIGAPSIYYGEEIAMSGGADPDNRRAMNWQAANDQNAMLQFYKRLISIRQNHRALQSGDVQVLADDDANNTFAFARTLDKESAIIAINRSDAARTMEVNLPPNITAERWKDALHNREIVLNGKVLRVQLAPLSAAILLPAR